MTVLELAPYEFQPEFLPPVFCEPALPVRELQVDVTLRQSFAGLSNWPPNLDRVPGDRVKDVVWKSEQSDDPIDVKDARILGMIAATTELELDDPLTLQETKLTPHLAMLNAIGSALTAGLLVSSNALQLAAQLQWEHTRNGNAEGVSFASPGSDSIIRGIRRTMRQYNTLYERGEKGAGHYIAYSLDSINETLHRTPPGPNILATYLGESAARPMVNLYTYILDQIDLTQMSVRAKGPELTEYLEDLYRQSEEWNRRDEERERSLNAIQMLPGLEQL